MNRFFIQMTRTTIKWYNLTHALGDCWVKHICKIVQQFNSNSTLWCLLSTFHAIIPYFRKISFQRFQGFQDDLQIGTEPRRPQAASLWFPTGVPFSSQGRYICNNYYLISDILHLSCFLSLLDLLKAWGVVNMLSCSLFRNGLTIAALTWHCCQARVQPSPLTLYLSPCTPLPSG